MVEEAALHPGRDGGHQTGAGYREVGRHLTTLRPRRSPSAKGQGGTHRIATYGDTSGAMEVLVEVLLGRSRAPGRLPVTMAGVERRSCD